MGSNSAAEETAENPHERVYYEALLRLTASCGPSPDCLPCIADIVIEQFMGEVYSFFAVKRVPNFSESSCVYGFYFFTLHLVR